jgi:class 3 adenylate cyclase
MPEESVQRKLSAIMFTDIVGYSKMMGEDETGSLEFLKFHNALLQGEIEKNGGRVIKTVGDAFLVDFNSAVNAVRCAVSIQKQLHDYNLGFTHSSGQKRQVRIGIHIGDVVMKNNDIFGDGVNIAARLQPIAEPGGICISQDVYNHIKNQVEFHATSLGPHELKNIAQKIEIYKIVTEVIGGAREKVVPPPPLVRKKNRGFNVLLGLLLFFVILTALAGVFWYYFAPKNTDFKSKYGFNSFFMAGEPDAHIVPSSKPGNELTRDPKNGRLHFRYYTSDTDGSGVTFYPVNGPFAADKYAIVEGCDMVQLHAAAPPGLRFQVSINESGVGPLGQSSYPGVNGADGEQYQSPVIIGCGKWKFYQIKLSEFSPSTFWGNQNGNKVLDLQAIDSLELDIPANQGEGSVHILSISFGKFNGTFTDNKWVVPVYRGTPPGGGQTVQK